MVRFLPVPDSLDALSLGVPGYTLHPDWGKVFFDEKLTEIREGKVAFVLAAGNNGTSQTEDISWDSEKKLALIIVGSVDVAGSISSFSNRPGTACLLREGTCSEKNRIMNMFMVAPGELILLPDGNGGFIRRSGTSFAAPLVSGAITLLHDRWPWLTKFPHETVDIMLRSARDLGDPGVDPVYGRGMLDVTASQAPLNFNNLHFFEVKNGIQTAVSAAEVKAGGVKTSWEAEGVYFHLFEPIGNTFRDFTVPLSSSLVGQADTLTGGTEYFQRFIEQRMKDWVTGASGFTDVATRVAPSAVGWQASISVTSPKSLLHYHGLAEMPQSSVRFASAQGGFALSAGVGNAGMALNGLEGLELSSDYGRDGGVNPLLGLATGDSFMKADVPISRNTSLSFGATRQHLDRSRGWSASPEEKRIYQGVDAFEAEAVNVRITHRPSSSYSMSLAYARVQEDNGLLGVQSRYKADLGHGAESETLTLAASGKLGRSITLAASATAGRTRTDGAPEQGIVTTGSGILTSAFAVAATKQGVLDSGDRLRVSLAQPLHIERGELSHSSIQVIDRKTGELGLVEQRFGISDNSRGFTGELLYASPILDGAGELGLFGRAELKREGSSEEKFAIGGRLNLAF